jgi:hypothetical protein
MYILTTKTDSGQSIGRLFRGNKAIGLAITCPLAWDDLTPRSLTEAEAKTYAAWENNAEHNYDNAGTIAEQYGNGGDSFRMLTEDEGSSVTLVVEAAGFLIRKI